MVYKIFEIFLKYFLIYDFKVKKLKFLNFLNFSRILRKFMFFHSNFHKFSSNVIIIYFFVHFNIIYQSARNLLKTEKYNGF